MMKQCNNLNYNNMKKIFTLLAVAFATLGASAQTLPGLDDVIKTQPEGTLHKDLNHYFEGAYVNATDNLIYDHLGDGYLSDIVEAADGSLYIKNPFGFFTHGDIWVRRVRATPTRCVCRRLCTTMRVTLRIRYSTLGATSDRKPAARLMP